MASKSRFRLSEGDLSAPSKASTPISTFLSSNSAMLPYKFTTTYVLNTSSQVSQVQPETASPCPQVRKKGKENKPLSDVFPILNSEEPKRKKHMGLDEAPQTNLQPSPIRYVMRTGRSENSFITRSKRRIRMGRA